MCSPTHEAHACPPTHAPDQREPFHVTEQLVLPDGALPRDPDATPRYTAYRTDESMTIDGALDEAIWQRVPWSSRFVDLVHGTPAIHDTRAAVLWDDDNLYVGFRIEEPRVQATLTERDALIYEDNDVELFIAGDDGYYEFEINAFGTIYEVFFLWEEAYQRGGYAAMAEFAREVPGVERFDGVGFRHPRGPRIGFWNWDFPGLQSAVRVDGTINDETFRDRGWTVELALPWAGLKHLAGQRSLPPHEGDVWRMDFSRFNTYREAPPANDSGGWAWSPHGVWDSHVPELFTRVMFTRQSP